MDTRSPGKEVSEELARESLIAISQSLPDKAHTLEVLPGHANGEHRVEVDDAGRADKYRSELISISYTDSPDIITLPVTVKSLNG